MIVCGVCHKIAGKRLEGPICSRVSKISEGFECLREGEKVVGYASAKGKKGAFRVSSFG